MAVKKVKTEKGKTEKTVKSPSTKPVSARQKGSQSSGGPVGSLFARVKAYFIPGETAEA